MKVKSLIIYRSVTCSVFACYFLLCCRILRDAKPFKGCCADEGKYPSKLKEIKCKPPLWSLYPQH